MGHCYFRTEVELLAEAVVADAVVAAAEEQVDEEKVVAFAVAVECRLEEDAAVEEHQDWHVADTAAADNIGVAAAEAVAVGEVLVAGVAVAVAEEAQPMEVDRPLLGKSL